MTTHALEVWVDGNWQQAIKFALGAKPRPIVGSLAEVEREAATFRQAGQRVRVVPA